MLRWTSRFPGPMLPTFPIRRLLGSLGLLLVLLTAQVGLGLCTARCDTAQMASPVAAAGSATMALDRSCCLPAGHAPLAPAQSCHEVAGVAFALPGPAAHAAPQAPATLVAAAGVHPLCSDSRVCGSSPRMRQTRPPTLAAPLRI